MLNVAIVGATGAVGRTLLALFAERGFACDRLSLVASARSAGSTLATPYGVLPVADLERFDFSGTDMAFFSAGTTVSRAHARRAASAGALVIDNTNAFRMDPAAPLVVPQVNGELLRERPPSGIIGNPNCTTIPLARALAAIGAGYHVDKVVVSTYQAASGGGVSGMDELRDDAARFLAGDTGPRAAGRFPAPLAFNVVPQIDVLREDGYTLEEHKIRQELRKILARPELAVSATCVRVPVLNGHSEAVYVRADRPFERAALVALLRAGEELTVGEDAAFPTPRFNPQPDFVHVGRVRIDQDDPHGAWFWLVSDNLRIGAALNALQIAERVLAARAYA